MAEAASEQRVEKIQLFWVNVDKVEEGDEWAFHVIASTDTLDKHGEVIDPQAIRKLKQVEQIPFCLAESHEAARVMPTAQIGWFYPNKDGPDNIYDGRVVLFKWHPEAAVYWQVVNENPSDQKCSIAGDLVAATTRRRPTRILDMIPDHILATRAAVAANPDTKVEVDMRTAVWKSLTAAVGGENMSMDTEELWDENEEADELVVEGLEELPRDADIEKADIEVSNKPWRTIGYAKRLPKECFLYVPDPEKKSTWKFPVYEGKNPDSDGNFQDRGPLNWHALRNAAARLIAIKNRLASGRGFRGMSDAEARDLVSTVAPKIVELYKKIGKPIPEALARYDKTAEEGGIMAKTSTIIEAVKEAISGVMGELLGARQPDAAPAEPPVAEPPGDDVAKTEEPPEAAPADASVAPAPGPSLEERLATLEAMFAEMKGVLEQFAAASVAKTDEPEEEPADIGKAVAEALQPLVTEVRTLQEQVDKIAKARGVSLQVEKASEPVSEPIGRRMGTLGPLDDFEGVLRAHAK